jgi:hypothetical protein
VTERFLARAGYHDLGNVLQHGADREQIAFVIVDDEHPRPLRRVHLDGDVRNGRGFQFSRAFA